MLHLVNSFVYQRTFELFSPLGFVTKAALNLRVQVFVQSPAFRSLGHTPSSRTAEAYGGSRPNFLKIFIYLLLRDRAHASGRKGRGEGGESQADSMLSMEPNAVDLKFLIPRPWDHIGLIFWGIAMIFSTCFQFFLINTCYFLGAFGGFFLFVFSFFGFFFENCISSEATVPAYVCYRLMDPMRETFERDLVSHLTHSQQSQAAKQKPFNFCSLSLS